MKEIINIQKVYNVIKYTSTCSVKVYKMKEIIINIQRVHKVIKYTSKHTEKRLNQKPTKKKTIRSLSINLGVFIVASSKASMRRPRYPAHNVI